MIVYNMFCFSPASKSVEWVMRKNNFTAPEYSSVAAQHLGSISATQPPSLRVRFKFLFLLDQHMDEPPSLRVLVAK